MRGGVSGGVTRPLGLHTPGSGWEDAGEVLAAAELVLRFRDQRQGPSN